MNQAALALTPEWERIHVLGHCLAQARSGQESASEELDRLRRLQSQVECIREAGLWRDRLEIDLSHLELDVLACTVGPDVDPRLGWMYQNLQAGNPQPYPSPALIQELLALDLSQAEQLRAALSPTAPLLARRLLRIGGDHPYLPLRPEAWVSAKLLGRALEPIPPPGASPVRDRARWEDIVLPESRLIMLREFLLWIRHRETVINRWGGRDAGGPVALFSGPSGTGKTFAASVLATELGWPLYRIDMGRLVSKYVGETEENLNSLFDAAHGQPMILQFDEADALFAKRGEVREARDRYANMEVSHLLTRLENHQGPCILTTNLRKQMDSAFARRFQIVMEFPRPDVTARTQLWQRLLPPRAPKSPDLDPAFLAAAVALTGGGIRNAALHAAYLAAGEGSPIGLCHAALGVWRELHKEGRDVVRQDLGELARFLSEEVFDDRD